MRRRDGVRSRGGLSEVDGVKMPIYMTKPIMVFLLERDLHNGPGDPFRWVNPRGGAPVSLSAAAAQDP